MFPIPTDTVETGWWTLLLWFALPPNVRDSLEDSSILAPSKKAFLLTSDWPEREYTWAHWFLYESYKGIPYSPRQIRKTMVNTLLMVNITLICKRWYLLIFTLCKEKKGKNLVYFFSKQIILALNPELFCQQTDEK